jgi:hypothetical protein
MLEDPAKDGKIKNILNFRGTGLRNWPFLCSRRRVINFNIKGKRGLRVFEKRALMRIFKS